MNLTHLPLLGCSDHECLLWQLFCNSGQRSFVRTNSYNYYQGDYDSLNNYLKEIDWFTKFNGHDINHNYNTFVQTILFCLDNYIPTAKRKNKQNPLGGPKNLQRPLLISQHFLPDGKLLKHLLTTWHMPSSATSLGLQHDLHNVTIYEKNLIQQSQSYPKLLYISLSKKQAKN